MTCLTDINAVSLALVVLYDRFVKLLLNVVMHRNDNAISIEDVLTTLSGYHGDIRKFRLPH